jgi:hypothetical protein
MPVDNADYLLGLQASALIRDGGTLQIGIGCLGDAIVHFCRMRQQQTRYQQLLADLRIPERYGELIERHRRNRSVRAGAVWRQRDVRQRLSCICIGTAFSSAGFMTAYRCSAC